MKCETALIQQEEHVEQGCCCCTGGCDDDRRCTGSQRRFCGCGDPDQITCTMELVD